MRFKIICVSSLLNLMFRHHMSKFIEKMNALWYEHQAVAARGALRRVGEGGRWRPYPDRGGSVMNELEKLREAYEQALKKLVEINNKNDWSPAGDREFYLQREEVYWAKCALVNAQNRADRVIAPSIYINNI